MGDHALVSAARLNPAMAARAMGYPHTRHHRRTTRRSKAGSRCSKCRANSPARLRGHGVGARFPGLEAFDSNGPVCVVASADTTRDGCAFSAVGPCATLVAHHDLVLAINSTYGGIAGLLARSLFGVPYAALAYGHEFLKFKRMGPRAALLRYIYAQSRGVIAISRFTRGQLIEFGVNGKKIAAILPGALPNPVVDDATSALRWKYSLKASALSSAWAVGAAKRASIARTRDAAPSQAHPQRASRDRGPGALPFPPVRAPFRMGVRDRITFAGR